MHWFRSRASLGSCLALFALTFQLAVCFGHLHLAGFRSDSGLAPLAQRLAVKPPVSLPDKPVAPTRPVRFGDDFCPICSVIQQASSAVPVATPFLPVPVMVDRNSVDASIDLALTASPHPSFRARAPPHA